MIEFLLQFLLLSLQAIITKVLEFVSCLSAHGLQELQPRVALDPFLWQVLVALYIKLHSLNSNFLLFNYKKVDL